MTPSGHLVVISGPSGVGKSTLVKEVLRRTGAAYSVSATTRPPRPGEKDGVDYRFMKPEEFEEMRNTGGTAEAAMVHGNWYGTPAEPLRHALATGQTILLDIDVQGAMQVHRDYPGGAYILILPPSTEELRRRLTARGTETAENVARRLAAAEKETLSAMGSGVYNHRVVNDHLEQAVDEVVKIVEAAGRAGGT